MFRQFYTGFKKDIDLLSPYKFTYLRENLLNFQTFIIFTRQNFNPMEEIDIYLLEKLIKNLKNIAVFIFEYEPKLDDYLIVFAEGEELLNSGLYQSRIIYRDLRQAIPSEEKFIRENLRKAFQGETIELERIQNARTYLYQFAPIRWRNNEVVLATCIWQNITYEKLIKFENKEINQVLENISWGISHQILHETAKIVGLIAIKSEIEEQEFSEQLKKTAEKLNDSCTEINQIIEKFLK